MNNTIYTPQTLRFNIVDSRYDKYINSQKSADFEWTELSEHFKTPDIRDNKDGVAFVLSVFKANHVVRNNVTDICAMILDYDSGEVTIDDIKDRFKDIRHLGYTSYSHTNEHHKFRVVIPFKTYCPVEEWKPREKSMIEFSGGYYEKDGEQLTIVDKSTFTIARIFYFPACPKEREHLFHSWTNEGEILDWTDFEKEVVIPRLAAKYESTGETLSSDDLNTLIWFADRSCMTIMGIYDSFQHDVWHSGIFAPRPGNDTSDPSKTDASFIISNGAVRVCDFANNNSITIYQVKKIRKVKAEDDKGDDVKPFIMTDYFKKKPKSEKQLDVEKIVPYESPIIINRINERYLPDAGLELIKKGVVLIKSPKDTGKTNLMVKIVDDLKKVLKPDEGIGLIAHRVNLLQNLSNRLDIVNYNDVKGSTQYFACCVDSISRRFKHDPFKRKVLIFDEIEQVLKHFIGGTLKANKRQVFAQFVKMVQDAELIICLDADLSYEISCQIITKFRGERFNDEDTQVILNEYKIGAGREIEIYKSKQQLLTEMQAIFDTEYKVVSTLEGDMQHLYNVKSQKFTNNAFISTNSKIFVQEAEKILKVKIDMGDIKSVKPEQILSVFSENGNMSPQKEFIIDPKSESNKYRAVISSPTISTGVSVEGNHFNYSFGFFNDGILSHFDIDQAMARVRNPNAVKKIWLNVNDDYVLEGITVYNEQGVPVEISRGRLEEIADESGFSAEQKKMFIDVLTETQRKKDYLESEDAQERLTEYNIDVITKMESFTRDLISLEDKLDDFMNLWIWFYSTLTTNEAIRMKDRGNKLIKLYEDQGYTIKYVGFEKEAHDKGAEDLKLNKLQTSMEHAIAVINAPTITENEKIEIEHREVQTSEDYFKVQKFLITSAFNLDPNKLDLEVVMNIYKQNMLSKTFWLDFLLQHPDTIKLGDMKERTLNTYKVVTDFKHRSQYREILDEAAHSMSIEGINGLEDLFKTTTASMKIDNASLYMLCSYANANKAKINALFQGNGKIGMGEKMNPKAVFNKLFGMIGILIDRPKRKVKEYYTDIDSCNLVLQKQHCTLTPQPVQKPATLSNPLLNIIKR